jgi:intein-encoded DNA endonuclease-like protein
METQIIKLYNSGLGMSTIAKQLNISSTKVWNILKYNNIEIRRKHSKINETYFDNPNTEKSAYWAGFIAADGYVYKPNNYVRLEINIKDKQHLELLGDDVGKNVTGYNKHNSCKLTISSKHIVNTLEQYNITQNKSLTLKFPTNINTENIHHFIRGYFDGDGSFYKIYDIIGNQQFLQLLVDNLPFKCEYSLYKPKDRNHHVLRIRTKSLQQFFEFMYKDATIYLDRKYQKQLAFYNKEISSK